MLRNKSSRKKWAVLLVVVMAFASLNMVALGEEPVGESYAPPGTTIEITPLTDEEIVYFEEHGYLPPTNAAGEHSLFSGSWNGTVNVPINVTGHEGVNLGPQFIPSPDNAIEIIVGNLPSNMPSVNISLQSQIDPDVSWWQANAPSNHRVTIGFGGYSSHTFQAKASTSEDESKAADFSWATYSTN